MRNKMQEYFLGSLTEENKMLNLWYTNLKICSSYQKFKIVTGTDIIPQNVKKKLGVTKVNSRIPQCIKEKIMYLRHMYW